MPRACLVPTLLLLLTATASAQDPFRYWAPAHRDAHKEYEKRLIDTVRPDALRAYHDKIASRPHRAGSRGDLHVVATLAGHFLKMGLAVEQQELFLYLAVPVAAELELVVPNRVKLPLREIGTDEYSERQDLSFGWNAFSGSGEATAEIVYANYGRKQDYEKLDELGVDLKGKIVVARYGGNFRGYKVKFAEARGAAGVILYTDPADSGWAKGLGWPEGGYANGSSIQRGSILTLPYRGDPLTPNVPATEHAERLDPKDVAFPKIPCQPVGWDAADKILKRMRGASVPDGWQGGLPYRYRLTGGKHLKVRLMVKQERKLVRTYNVTGTLKGARFPDQMMVVGAHHDAWGFGAGDPTSGTILVLEAARCFTELARDGKRPARTIVFAGWAAEEYGIMGSVEWVEAHKTKLSADCIAYLNLDMASMGPNVRCAAAPSLKTVINECIEAETGKPLKRFGNLGGGSDHIGFYCHLGIPSAGLGAGGSKGVSYHSHYDNLAWYRKIVGDDYAHASKLARIVNRVLARVSNADLLPLDPVLQFAEFQKHLDAIEALAREREISFDATELRKTAEGWEGLVRRWNRDALEAVGKFPAKTLNQRNRRLMAMERAWLSTATWRPFRPWFRNLYAAPDEDSGYAAWMLPALRWAIKHRDLPAFATAQQEMTGVFLEMGRQLNADDAKRQR